MGKNLRTALLATLVTGGLVACGDDAGSPAPSDASAVPGTTDAASAADASGGQEDAASDAVFEISWTLTGGCLDGDEVEAELNNNFDGRTFIKRFPCTATGSGVSDPVGAGLFSVQLRVVDNDLAMLPDAGLPDGGQAPPAPGPLVAESALSEGHESVANSSVPLSFTFPTNTATIAAGWSFQDARGSQSCAEAGVAFVDLEYELVGDSVVRTVRHDCTDLTDDSGDLSTGLYLVRAETRSAGEAIVHPQEEVSTALFVGNRAGTASFSFGPL